MTEKTKTFEQEVKEAVTKISEQVKNGLLKQEEAFNSLSDDLEKRLKSVEDKAISNKSYSLPGLEEDNKKKKFNLIRACLAVAHFGKDYNDSFVTQKWNKAGLGFELSVMKETTEKFASTKAMDTVTDSAAGLLVPEQVLTEFIEKLKANSVVLKSGARQLTGLTGSPVKIPRQASSVTVSYVAEGSAVSETNPTFEQISLTPHKLMAATRISNDLLRMSNPAVENIVRDDMASEIGLKQDLSFLRGDGTANDIVGISNLITSTEKLPHSNVTTFDKLINQYEKLEVANAAKGRLAWIFHPKTISILRKLKDSQNQYLWQPAPSQAVPTTIIGFPYSTTTQIPSNLGAGSDETECYLANWEEVLIGSWGGLDIASSNVAEDTFLKDQTLVRIISRIDMQLRHIQSVAMGTSVQTA